MKTTQSILYCTDCTHHILCMGAKTYSTLNKIQIILYST
uniref:Uncharacterized protein n=1 Tax=Anguilla anguilla TaxID=7936 RepID=A0A0E9WKD1_ANGAN